MLVYWAFRRMLAKVSCPEKRWKLSAGQPVVRTAPARRKLTRRSAHVPSRSLGARTRRCPLHPARFWLHARWFPLPAAAGTVSPGPGSGYLWPGFVSRFLVRPGGSWYSLPTPVGLDRLFRWRLDDEFWFHISCTNLPFLLLTAPEQARSHPEHI